MPKTINYDEISLIKTHFMVKLKSFLIFMKIPVFNSRHFENGRKRGRVHEIFWGNFLNFEV